jgi:hypothetical protein
MTRLPKTIFPQRKLQQACKSLGLQKGVLDHQLECLMNIDSLEEMSVDRCFGSLPDRDDPMFHAQCRERMLDHLGFLEGLASHAADELKRLIDHVHRSDAQAASESSSSALYQPKECDPTASND